MGKGAHAWCLPRAAREAAAAAAATVAACPSRRSGCHVHAGATEGVGALPAPPKPPNTPSPGRVRGVYPRLLPATLHCDACHSAIKLHAPSGQPLCTARRRRRAGRTRAARARHAAPLLAADALPMRSQLCDVQFADGKQAGRSGYDVQSGGRRSPVGDNRAQRVKFQLVADTQGENWREGTYSNV